MSKYPNYSGNTNASELSDPKLPARPGQGDAAEVKFGKVIRGKNGQGASGLGKVVKADNTPGRGTRGKGTTHGDADPR